MQFQMGLREDALSVKASTIKSAALAGRPLMILEENPEHSTIANVYTMLSHYALQLQRMQHARRNARNVLDHTQEHDDLELEEAWQTFASYKVISPIPQLYHRRVAFSSILFYQSCCARSCLFQA